MPNKPSFNHASSFDVGLDTQLKSLKDTHNFRTITDYQHNDIFITPYVSHAYHLPHKPLINFASNDYLALSLDATLVQEFLSTLCAQDIVFSSASSRSLSGGFPIYDTLESHLSQLYAPKKALLFNSGYHCNLSCIQALGTLTRTLFLLDRFSHASVFDGVRNAHFKRFKHNDIAALATLVESYHRHYERVIIVTEGLFSMEGDFCKINDIIQLKKTYPNVFLYIDEAHSVGVCGKDGLGIAYEYIEEIDFLVLTFGKALASVGACMLCNTAQRDFFVNTSRGLIYSTALPPINVAWSSFIWSKIPTLNHKREKLQLLSHHLCLSLKEKGYTIRGEAHIISLMCGDNHSAIKLSKKLRERGFFAPAIKEPTIPKGTARIRFSLNANLELEHIFQLAEAL
ncbi:8-amino-7-oxononanoate synthase [Helicobacter cinaedi]|uniref:8-amino-7-oxononanoate synthase n=1 Tax=Helicobacter cinaedi CCUG 18818 = ATCC BAA-847 TaxID=537971 RepID=A0AAI8MQG9_9HELI|nr:aminotransferase class I/II-fold pyridoxal phosphate-dependent enzyme [Helicobacter cinaedi]AWK62584.1 8-amino-7-oxononanoate synthase [Helicobacter cinaedi]BAM33511.1 8-amino-7-oxononanoate synthase [Helicobacter cinaedi CCUG 18818 = ATCC BAA-847]